MQSFKTNEPSFKSKKNKKNSFFGVVKNLMCFGFVTTEEPSQKSINTPFGGTKGDFDAENQIKTIESDIKTIINNENNLDIYDKERLEVAKGFFSIFGNVDNATSKRPEQYANLSDNKKYSLLTDLDLIASEANIFDSIYHGEFAVDKDQGLLDYFNKVKEQSEEFINLHLDKKDYRLFKNENFSASEVNIKTAGYLNKVGRFVKRILPIK